MQEGNEIFFLFFVGSHGKLEHRSGQPDNPCWYPTPGLCGIPFPCLYLGSVALVYPCQHLHFDLGESPFFPYRVCLFGPLGIGRRVVGQANQIIYRNVVEFRYPHKNTDKRLLVSHFVILIRMFRNAALNSNLKP